MSVRHVLAIVAFAIAVIIAAALFVGQSVWVVWLTLPPAPLRYACQTHEICLGLSDPLAPELFKTLQDDLYALGISRDQNEIQIAIAPRLVRYASVYSRLKRSGIEFKIRGPVIVVGQSLKTPEENITPASNSASLFTIIRHRLPLFPAAIVSYTPREGEASYLPGFFSVATRKDDRIRAIIASSLVNMRSQPGLRRYATVESSDLHLDLPGHVLLGLGPKAQENLNNHLRQALGLEITSPDIIGYISQYEQVSIALISGQGAQVTVMGATDSFAAAVEQWLRLEQEYAHPQRKYFRLPDGTLGREIVPGTSDKIFSDDNKDGCRKSATGSKELYLCVQGGIALIRAGEEQKYGLKSSSGIWRMHLTEKAIASFMSEEMCKDNIFSSVWCRIRTLAIQGNDGYAAADIELR